MQIVSKGDNLQEMSDPIFCEKKKKMSSADYIYPVRYALIIFRLQVCRTFK